MFDTQKRGGDLTLSNSTLNFQHHLSHRTTKFPQYNSKPLWGHTSFRGALFSEPDHISEIKIHQEEYDSNPDSSQPFFSTPAAKSTSAARPRSNSNSSSVASRRSSCSSSTTNSRRRNPGATLLYLSTDHPSVNAAVSQHGVDETPAGSNPNFQNYLAHRTSPKHQHSQHKKPKWGHTSFRGALFSHPDHSSEIRLHRDSCK